MRERGEVQILPAIDLRGGQCVRLRQGDYEQETVFGNDPASIACRWVEQGATFLHLVDLDGAREGRLVHDSAIRQIVETAGVPCQLGGGLRTERDIATVLDWGIARVIVGTRALKDPEWFRQICQRHEERIVLGLDAREGRVATDGWSDVSSRSALDFARQCADWPLAALVYTDIHRDGMMQGPNLEVLAELVRVIPTPIIASGGVTTLDDIHRLLELNVAGCIIGRALYEGRLDLPTALALAQAKAH